MSTKTDGHELQSLNQPVELPQSGFHRADKYQAAFEYEDDETFLEYLKERRVPHFVANRKTWVQAEALFEKAVEYETQRKPGWFAVSEEVGRKVGRGGVGAGKPAKKDTDGKDQGGGATEAPAAPKQGRKPRGRRQ